VHHIYQAEAMTVLKPESRGRIPASGQNGRRGIIMKDPQIKQYATATSAPDPSVAAAFSDKQLQTLMALRETYEPDYDLFSVRELARLRFVRWLVEQGRLES
jgi:hypothetical protein